MEQIYDKYPDIILQFPCLCGFPLEDHVHQHIAAFFHTNSPEWTFHTWLKFIPNHAKHWGKLHIPDGDSIQCVAVVDPLSTYGKQDLSFVQYLFQQDENKDHPNLAPKMVNAFGYRHLNFIIAITLPASKKFTLQDPELHILTHITEAKGAKGNALTKFVLFTQFGFLVILNISSVQSVVGHVYTTGMKALGEWYIIYCSLSLCKTVFHPPEH
ncbi:unnamed protein product [Rhizoctonia solani]|uniref:Uncharacterized protein n=1 Tax=Rhizoctonia solani TaxID=456999 RepID=A0A8H3C8U5_9AGAM|nr:unnamed protein product [Rhizoctonia solani]